ncbi:MAG: KH domain-containing protein [Candidatus Methylacidiphilales bacterium]|nr:KH domain-containing protein [Candidatus Methylacidiphilales bacterium]
MRHFLEFAIQRLVEHRDDVDITEANDGKTVTFRIALHADDVGRVIGKHGRTISAIRSLLNAAGARSDMRVVVAIFEAGAVAEPA